MPQSNSELCLQKTSVHYLLADKYAANQRGAQLRIAMLAGDFWETLVVRLLHSRTGLSNKSAKCYCPDCFGKRTPEPYCSDHDHLVTVVTTSYPHRTHNVDIVLTTHPHGRHRTHIMTAMLVFNVWDLKGAVQFMHRNMTLSV